MLQSNMGTHSYTNIQIWNTKYTTAEYLKNKEYKAHGDRIRTDSVLRQKLF